MPLAFGARESALSDLSKGNSYYEGFQPTSFENALSNQYFQNVWPDTQESIKHGMSLSGLDSSPLLAASLGKARGNLETSIGQYLSDQGNTRATNSLNSRLGIDPNNVISPYVTTDTNQSNSQDQLNYDYQQQLAQAAYQQEVDKYNQQNALYKTLGMVSPIGGAIYGGISGGSNGLSTSMSGSIDMMKSILPMLTRSNGLSGMFGGGTGAATQVNPSAYSAMLVNPVNYSMGTSNYDPRNYFAGFGNRGGAV